MIATWQNRHTQSLSELISQIHHISPEINLHVLTADISRFWPESTLEFLTLKSWWSSDKILIPIHFLSTFLTFDIKKFFFVLLFLFLLFCPFPLYNNWIRGRIFLLHQEGICEGITDWESYLAYWSRPFWSMAFANGVDFWMTLIY